MSKKIPFTEIDKSWTIFLDRDGVINKEKHKDYIHSWEEFFFYENAEKAIRIFSELFGRIIVVTNQKGVGKGVTLQANLEVIHENMTVAIESAGGRLDAIYYCPDLDDNSSNRKPNHGMGLMAKEQFPEIDFSKSLMIGNTISDMEFARNLGVYSIFLPTTRPEVDLNDERIDEVFSSLYEAAIFIKKNKE